MEIYTIGFTQKSAEQFFETLKRNRIQRLVDIRLRNTSQLAGFAKQPDLQYFLRQICNMEYVYEPLLAPTDEILDEYKKKKGNWSEYRKLFLALMKERKIETVISPELFSVPSVLLCSEAKAEECHRSLVVEYLEKRWKNITPIHL